MTTITIDHVLSLAHQLPRAGRAELIARLAQELALLEEPATAVYPTADHDAWDDFLALADDPEVQTPLSQDSATLISEMRR